MRLKTIDLDKFESNLENSCKGEHESWCFVNFLSYLDEEENVNE